MRLTSAIKKITFTQEIQDFARWIGLVRRYRQDFREFAELNRRDGRFAMRWRDRYPVLNERTSTTEHDRVYTYHPAWAVRVLAQTRPAMHVDISSIIHFSAMLSAFLPVEFYDYRPANLRLSNLRCGHADLCALSFADKSIASLSCMHVVEHIGLGRYGDPLDASGDVKAMRELQRVLALDGSLLFAVPLGRPRVSFNGHRVYSRDQIVQQFADLKLEQFAFIPDDAALGDLIEDADADMAQNEGCGCFWFKNARSARDAG